MEPSQRQILVKSDPYFSGNTRLIMILICSILLIKISTPIGLFTLLFMKRFYFALCFNLILASIVIELVHRINVFLDRRINWHLNPYKRLIWQFILGVVCVLYLDYWLVRGVYFILNKDFGRSDFMIKVFPVIVVLILILQTLFYLRKYDPILFSPKIWIAFLFNRKKPKDIFEELSGNQVRPLNEEHWKSVDVKVNYWASIEGFIQSTKYTFRLEEVLCIGTGAVYGDIFLKSGRVCNMHYKGKVLIANLDPDQFIQIRSGLFYSLDCIKGVRKEGERRSLILKKQYAEIEVNRVISRRYYTRFLKKFKTYNRNKDIDLDE